MVSLFAGFVFVGLLQLLTASDPLDAWRIAIVWLLTIALIALTTALRNVFIHTRIAFFNIGAFFTRLVNSIAWQQ